MSTGCLRSGCAAILQALILPAIACTQGESEDKVREAIYALSDVEKRDPDKAQIARQRIDRALDEALKPATVAQAQQDRTHKLCKEMDEILAELRR